MPRRDGKATAVDDLKVWMEENHPDSEIHEKFYVHANKTRNALKHFSGNDESSVFVDEAEAKYWLTRAVMNYDRSHAILTKPMFKLISWLKQSDA